MPRVLIGLDDMGWFGGRGDEHVEEFADGSLSLEVVRDRAAWDIGGLFFGLWLIPMGWVVRNSKAMPAVLGWVLMVGGVAYVISTYLTQLFPDAPTAVGSLLVGVATIGEFWMIGYRLFGVRSPDRTPQPRSPTPVG